MYKREPDPLPIVLSAKQEKTLFWLDKTAELLDNRFRIPFTNVRFGLDAIIGLFPYVGDVAGLVISALLVFVIATNGASGMVALRMAGNILLDATVGIIPIFGDIFDLHHKANIRNVHLLRAHYREGKYQGSALMPILVVLLALAGAFFVMIYIVWQVFSWVWHVTLGS